MKRVRSLVLGFISIHMLWLFFSLLLSTRALPSPFTVYANFGQVLHSGIFLHMVASLYRIFAGVCISLLTGIPVGYLMARFYRINQLLSPLVYFAYPIPKTALLPIAMLLLGLRNGSKIWIMVLTMVFQVIITTRDSIEHISPSVYQVGRSAGKSEGFLFWHITAPAILPELFTGLRINLGTALAILMIVEAYGTEAGIGYYILDAWARINYNEMYGGIIVISLMGAMLFLLVDVVSDRICRWKR